MKNSDTRPWLVVRQSRIGSWVVEIHRSRYDADKAVDKRLKWEAERREAMERAGISLDEQSFDRFYVIRYHTRNVALGMEMDAERSALVEG